MSYVCLIDALNMFHRSFVCNLCLYIDASCICHIHTLQWKQDVRVCGFGVALRAKPYGPNGNKMWGRVVLVLLCEQIQIAQMETRCEGVWFWY